MAEHSEAQEESVTVREFSGAPMLNLDLKLVEGQVGLGNEIRSPRIQKLGLALAGFTGYLHPGRIQIIGSSEMNYLRMLKPEERSASFHRLQGLGISCVVITRSLDSPAELLELVRHDRIPLLRSSAPSAVAISRISDYLEARLAPRTTIHGVLLDVFGLGVLLLGPSGIGKSECALELILKGHRLVADDYIEITRRGIDHLVGSGSQILKHHMELRGIGIIDVRELFGVSATGASQALDFAVRLERWNSEADYDRLGFDQSKIDYLGVGLPLIVMPVAPGRNVSALVEVAARIQLLKRRGCVPSRELEDVPGLNSGDLHNTDGSAGNSSEMQ